jgi:hypothetical protein
VHVKLYRHICKYLNRNLYLYTPKYVYTAMGTVGTLGGMGGLNSSSVGGKGMSGLANGDNSSQKGRDENARRSSSK